MPAEISSTRSQSPAATALRTWTESGVPARSASSADSVDCGWSASTPDSGRAKPTRSYASAGTSAGSA